MFDARGDLRLPLEAFKCDLIVDQFWPQHAHTNEIAQHGSLRTIKRAGRILGQDFVEHIAPVEWNGRRQPAARFDGGFGRIERARGAKFAGQGDAI